ncbi:MAG TPA: radical SAM protein [Rectinemataceae bacterium]|nr:radical SAM protein [Rectinemataceae bacterium]
MDDSIDILGMSSDDFAAAATGLLESGAGLAGALYSRAFATGKLEPEALGAAGRSAQAWRRRFRVGLLEVLKVVDEEGEFGITSKAVMAADDGSRIECVRIPMPSRPGMPARSSLCVSSQVGCRMGCAFCETGRAGLKRNLNAAEIVAQCLTARVKLGWEVGNIVFMGMGEPLDNVENLAAALRVLGDRRGFAFSMERITVCSSCPPGGLEALRSLGLKRLNLSISLNAGLEKTRNSIMPIGRANGLDALAASAAVYPQRRNFVLGVNYCLIPGVNDGREEARGVARFCAEIGRSLVNLIPYNPGSAPLSRPPTEEEIERFEAALREDGCQLRRRAKKGGAIMAGCGQLGSAAKSEAISISPD